MRLTGIFFLLVLWVVTESQPVKDPIEDVQVKVNVNVTVGDESTSIPEVLKERSTRQILTSTTGTPIKDHKKGPRLWPTTVISYNYSVNSDEFTPEEITTIEDALTVWSNYSCITFSTTDSKNFIKFQKGSSCQSEIGMKGGEQTIQISDNCKTKSAIVKMLGHAIGLENKEGQSNNDSNLVTSGKEALVTFDDIRDVNTKYGCQYDTRFGFLCWLVDDFCPGDGFVGTECGCWCRGSTGSDIYQHCAAESETLGINNS